VWGCFLIFQQQEPRGFFDLRIIVTGGGTGGHIYPALAIAQGLLARYGDVKILYVGTKNGMEAKIVPEQGLDFRGIAGKGLPRRLSIELLKTTGLNIKALWETKRILKEFKPDLVIGTGGYVTGPVVITAAFFGIPTLIHEQNALPGKTNKLLARVVKKVLVAFPESARHFKNRRKVKVVGLPVREEIGKLKRETGAEKLGLDPEKKTLLVTGGSRGALSINKALIYVLEQLRAYPNLQLIWATGTATHKQILEEMSAKGIDKERFKNWQIVEYLTEMPAALACSDLCICRAGATTLAELSVAGKASVLIPYPYAAENHQEYNAKVFEDRGAAKVILDEELEGPVLWAAIRSIITDQNALDKMSARAKEIFDPQALEKIVRLCRQTAWR
jgi:UDP-N-acetylglucosamine--N-acetylmuramyl-(pentapeptide) pyrophosphoryl-undecaprenol N-acetylglucosamine transferase